MSHRRGAVERQRAIEEVFIQLFSVLLCSGKGVDDVRAVADSCIKSASEALRAPGKTGEDGDAQDFGSILRTWHRQAKYLSSDGYPRQLKLGGRNGLRALIGQYYPRTQIETILSALISAGLIKEVRQSFWIPTGRYAVFPHLTGELLDHLSEGVSRLVETVIGNVTTDDKEQVLFERSAKVRQFPAESADEFREFTKNQAIAFLGAVDDWMEARAEAVKRRRGKKCTAGVFTFAFMDKVRKTGVQPVKDKPARRTLR